MQIRLLFLLVVCLACYTSVHAQLLTGHARSEINFREGPGTNFKVLHTIDHSNLLVILPREAQNGFIEAFDVETSSRGYIFENLIVVTDTLHFQTQQFFEKAGENVQGDTEIELINRTSHSLFVWINKNSYSLAPLEKKVLILESEEIIYFVSAPGLFPVFGREILQKGNTFRWNFSL
ncbi:MAG: hypothetical protein IPM71_00280 [Bacteroidota bacterium]|nr:MAG: hypothetical protein IPM71_00280 [Bacteroidota bacterium]